MSKIAIVAEDTTANRIFYERFLTQAGFKVKSVSTGKEAIELIDTSDSIALAVFDMELPDMSGLQLTSYLKQKFPDTYTIIATMHDERSLMQSAFSKGCNLFVVKPHGIVELFQLLTQNQLPALLKRPAQVIDQYGLRQFASTQGV